MIEAALPVYKVASFIIHGVVRPCIDRAAAGNVERSAAAAGDILLHLLVYGGLGIGFHLRDRFRTEFSRRALMLYTGTVYIPIAVQIAQFAIVVVVHVDTGHTVIVHTSLDPEQLITRMHIFVLVHRQTAADGSAAAVGFRIDRSGASDRDGAGVAVLGTADGSSAPLRLCGHHAAEDGDISAVAGEARCQ